MNNYDDYYDYMNYMASGNDISNYGISNLNMTYQNTDCNIAMPNCMEERNYGVNSQNYSNSNFDNNNFLNNFMIPSINNELLEPKEALEKGNMFKNLYVPYKNYEPVKIENKTEKQRMINEIRSYAFAMKELNLYLDVNPNNTAYINLYNEYRKTKEKLCEKYEKMYGPLNLMSSSLEKNNWIWNNSPWPWEGDK